MEKLKDLLAQSGFINKTYARSDFKAIESFIGFRLPDDYKYYLDNYEVFDDFIGQQYFTLNSIEDVLEFNRVYNLDERLANVVAIGSNGASEAIGIKFIGKDDYRLFIAQYIHDIDDHIEIGVSFTDMLERLINGEGWLPANGNVTNRS